MSLKLIDQGSLTRTHNAFVYGSSRYRSTVAMAIFPRATSRGSTPLNEHGQPVDPRLAWSHVADRQVDEIIGLCKGVLSDGAVNQSEAQFLLDWLESNRHAASKWPAKVIYPRIQAMLEDGILDDDEEKELLDLLMDITGAPKVGATGRSASSTLPLDDPPPRVAFHGVGFCLTGQFAWGSRRQVEERITLRGGFVKPNPSKKTNFLVIGEIGSRDWIHSTFGRKIEKAVELREQGHAVSLIAEQRFIDYLVGDL